MCLVQCLGADVTVSVRLAVGTDLGRRTKATCRLEDSPCARASTPRAWFMLHIRRTQHLSFLNGRRRNDKEFIQLFLKLLINMKFFLVIVAEMSFPQKLCS